MPSEKFIETLLDYAKAEQRKECDREARAYLDVTGRNYGETQSSVVILRAETFAALRQMLRDRRWRRFGDNPGQLYAQSCELLKLIRAESEWIGVCIVSNHYDV